jgi:lysophospholipase L1-like esterase
MRSYSYLALGDSYTIGESVLITENFPAQTVQLLRKEGIDMEAPEIIAKTGWTTDELQAAIDTHHFRPRYDFVTLLIGVNNQYRGRSTAEYEKEFTALLEQAIQFAGNNASQVAVLSIPDWGVTPFAEGRDREQIAREIDAYNAINRNIAEARGVHYIYITGHTREAVKDAARFAPDGLHPSAKEYSIWSEKLAAFFKSRR